MAAIDVRGVTKQYGDVTALHDLDMTVEDGEIFGFLGPNGAGKSTTIDILLDFVRPTAGDATVLGEDAQADSVDIRSRTGVLPDNFDVYERLSGRKHVEFAIESKGVDEDPDAVLDRVGLTREEGNRRAGGYSSGMRQRLALGMALVGDPELLILDEPTTGIDPNGAREMREIINAERDRGATIFFSSHILGQVEAVCDRVGILREGELVAVDTIEGLRETTGSGTQLSVTVDDTSQAVTDAVRAVDGVSEVSVAGEDSLAVVCETDAKRAVLDAAEEAGATVQNFNTGERSLEDIFVHYTEGDR
jgi:ABC-2 type transport system ATP-binding protein